MIYEPLLTVEKNVAFNFGREITRPIDLASNGMATADLCAPYNSGLVCFDHVIEEQENI